MKYIVMRAQLGKASGVMQLVPIIFPNQLVHADVFRQMKGLYKGKVSIVSAGDINLKQVDCCGDSKTLGVNSRESKDDSLINTYDYLHGIE